MTTDTETNVAYHRDGFGRGRPAINVKMYARVWDLPKVLELDARVGTEHTEELLQAAEETLYPRWWDEAAAKAEEYNLGPITQEGRSGGWLVFTDGTDPQAMGGNDRKDWLAAYRLMDEWCDTEVDAMPARLAAEAVRREHAERFGEVTVYPEGYTGSEPTTTKEVPIITHCLWCRQGLVDGKEESGFTGEGPDYMLPDGDFGCGDSPDTGEDGTGSHTPDEFETKDGHLIRVTGYTHIRALWPERDALFIVTRREADRRVEVSRRVSGKINR